MLKEKEGSNVCGKDRVGRITQGHIQAEIYLGEWWYGATKALDSNPYKKLGAKNKLWSFSVAISNVANRYVNSIQNYQSVSGSKKAKL